MASPNPDRLLPDRGDRLTLAAYRLETIARAIHVSFIRLSTRPVGDLGLSVPREAYVHFRLEAFRLLTHFVDEGLQGAFKLSLMASNAMPKKVRPSVADNPFHWGLIAMSAAAGPFMSRNKLLDLANQMRRAHANGTSIADFEVYRKRERKNAAIESEALIREAIRRGYRPERLGSTTDNPSN